MSEVVLEQKQPLMDYDDFVVFNSVMTFIGFIQNISPINPYLNHLGYIKNTRETNSIATLYLLHGLKHTMVHISNVITGVELFKNNSILFAKYLYIYELLKIDDEELTSMLFKYANRVFSILDNNPNILNEDLTIELIEGLHL